VFPLGPKATSQWMNITVLEANKRKRIKPDEHLTEVPSLSVKFSGPSFSSVDVSIDIVWNELCKLNPSKSGNPDGCHPHVFREVKEGLLLPLL